MPKKLKRRHLSPRKLQTETPTNQFAHCVSRLHRRIKGCRSAKRTRRMGIKGFAGGKTLWILFGKPRGGGRGEGDGLNTNGICVKFELSLLHAVVSNVSNIHADSLLS
ncbi:hypothetical protein Trydic_g17994 [Trypoxylus dichotomus]